LHAIPPSTAEFVAKLRLVMILVLTMALFKQIRTHKPHIEVFQLFCFLVNLLLVRSHQAVTVMCLIQRYNNVTIVWVQYRYRNYGHRKNEIFRSHQ